MESQEFDKKLITLVNAWRNEKVKLAVAGESGVGKSTFINSIRGLKADDPEAAPVGVNETTIDCKQYCFPNHPNVEIWDLPGFNTLTHSEKAKYVRHVKFAEYDFILLLSANRYTANDAWIAKEILKGKQLKHTLYFVRTKVDNDISNTIRSLRTKPTNSDIEEIIQSIRQKSSEQLRTQGIANHEIFLIDSYSSLEFDFRALMSALIEKVDDLKREALMFAFHGFTEDIDPVLKALKGRINEVSKAAAVASAYSERIRTCLLRK